MVFLSCCGLLTLQVGTTVTSATFLVIGSLTVGVNVFDYEQHPLNSWPVDLFLTLVFAILMLLAGVLIFFAAFNESRVQCFAGVGLIAVIIVYWLVLTAFSFVDNPADARRVCVKDRCGSTFWLNNLNFRPRSQISSSNNDRDNDGSTAEPEFYTDYPDLLPTDYSDETTEPVTDDLTDVPLPVTNSSNIPPRVTSSVNIASAPAATTKPTTAVQTVPSAATTKPTTAVQTVPSAATTKPTTAVQTVPSAATTKPTTAVQTVPSAETTTNPTAPQTVSTAGTTNPTTVTSTTTTTTTTSTTKAVETTTVETTTIESYDDFPLWHPHRKKRKIVASKVISMLDREVYKDSEDKDVYADEIQEANKETAIVNSKSNDYEFGAPFLGAVIFSVVNFVFLILSMVIIWSYAQELKWRGPRPSYELQTMHS